MTVHTVKLVDHVYYWNDYRYKKLEGNCRILKLILRFTKNLKILLLQVTLGLSTKSLCVVIDY